MYERLLEDFALQGDAAASGSHITLTNPQGFTYTLSVFNPTTLRVALSGPDRPLPPNANITASSGSIKLAGLEVDESTKHASFTLEDGKRVDLDWVESISLRVSETLSDGTERSVFETLRNRGYLLSERGMISYNKLIVDAIHVGLGEKGAPIGERSKFDTQEDGPLTMIPAQTSLIALSRFLAPTELPTMRTSQTR